MQTFFYIFERIILSFLRPKRYSSQNLQIKWLTSESCSKQLLWYQLLHNSQNIILELLLE